MHTRPPSVTLTLGLVLLGAIIWLVFGVLLALNAHPAFPDEPFVRGWMTALSLGAGCALLFLLILLAQRRRPAYYAALGALALASVAIFLDDVGLVDLVVLAVFLMPLILLVKDRAWYTGA
jgi:hypothetical protein